MRITNEKNDIQEVLFSREQIAGRVKELGKMLTEKFGDKRPIMLCVLKGASYFYVDLCREMKCHIDMDFIAVSSYGKGSKSSGVVKFMKDMDMDIEDRDVIIVEDIIDSGRTLKYLNQTFSSRGASSVTTITFLKKKISDTQLSRADYFGFEIPDVFVVGYGLDYAGSYRNLPYIGILKPECYE